MCTGAGPQLPLGTRELIWRGGPDQRAGGEGGWAAGPHSVQSSTPWARGCPPPRPWTFWTMPAVDRGGEELSKPVPIAVYAVQGLVVMALKA